MATAGRDARQPSDLDVTVRPARATDHGAIVELAGEALGWRPGEPNDELFRWKHIDNAFGPSALWVAEHDGRLAAFRAMMRWRFVVDGTVVSAVRAVDTATRPDLQGRGLFRQLTSLAVDELTAAGTAFVFNTPNANSRPGYLRMGWEVVGRVPVAVKVSSAGALVRLVRARVPADKWSLDTGADEPAEVVLADEPALDALLASAAVERGVRTDRTGDYLRWRYAGGPVRYRAALAGAEVEDGVALYRLRRRGAAIEATVADVLVPADQPRRARSLIDRIVRTTGADYAITTRWAPGAGRLVRLPGQGPILTWRALAQQTAPPADAWNLALGDVELF